jgi:hypothetical protein
MRAQTFGSVARSAGARSHRKPVCRVCPTLGGLTGVPVLFTQYQGGLLWHSGGFMAEPASDAPDSLEAAVDQAIAICELRCDAQACVQPSCTTIVSSANWRPCAAWSRRATHVDIQADIDGVTQRARHFTLVTRLATFLAGHNNNITPACVQAPKCKLLAHYNKRLARRAPI